MASGTELRIQGHLLRMQRVEEAIVVIQGLTGATRQEIADYLPIYNGTIFELKRQIAKGAGYRFQKFLEMSREAR